MKTIKNKYKKTNLITKLLLISPLVSSSAFGFTTFVDLDTPDDAILAEDGGTATITNTTLSNNEFADFRFAVVGDRILSFDENGNGGGENNNVNNITGQIARVSISNLVGGGSLQFDGRDLNGNNRGSFFVTTIGNVSSFQLDLQYLNSDGGALGLAGRANTNQQFGPMVHVNVNSFLAADQTARATTVGLGILDGNFDLITTETFSDITGGGQSATVTPVQTDGILTFELPGSEEQRANIRDFNNEVPNGEVNNDQNDFFSGATVRIATTDGGNFADSTVFNLSFDSQIVSQTGVIPEPSSTALIGLGFIGLLCRRSRK